MVLIKKLFRSYSKEICRSKALRYRRSSRSTRKEDYKLSKDEFQIVKVQIVAGETQQRQVTETIKRDMPR
jgi:hypothetical protein